MSETKTLKPEDFGASMIDQARRLYHNAMAVSSSGTGLDSATSMWLVRYDQRARLFREIEAMDSVHMTGLRRFEMLGIPIRFTADDEDGIPELQLVMEPRIRHSQ